jgi:antagonist of KipI
MEIRIVRAGMQTTVQDLGRRGHRNAGVPLSGAMDSFALRVANALVGNADNTAALEFALVGPAIEFSADTLVAVGGAQCEGAPAWTQIAVRSGERLDVGACVRGCRGYLAIAGGIEVEPVLGSRSTYLRGGFGGFEGRALRDGDVLRVNADDKVAAVLRGKAAGNWHIDRRILPAYSREPTVRIVRGAHASDRGESLCGPLFKISPRSDRMGLRLEGPKQELARGDLLSSAVAPGTIQMPPDGQPLILMADAQTIGGYPQVGHVITVDLPLIAQLRPGDGVRFTEIALDEAHKLALAREHALAMLHEGLAQKLG